MMIRLVETLDTNSRIGHPRLTKCNQWCTQEFCLGGGEVQQIQLRTEDRQNGDLGGGSPLVRGSGGNCNLVQQISFHIVKFLNFWYFKTIYDDHQFICHC